MGNSAATLRRATSWRAMTFSMARMTFIDRRRPRHYSYRHSMRKHPFRPGLLVLATALGALAIKSFLFDLAVVEGRSMLPLLSDGGLVLVFRAAYGLRLPSFWGTKAVYVFRWAAPRRGDIVAASSPRDGGAVVKRVAMEGPGFYPSAIEGSPEALGIFVPSDSYILLGDNPLESIDSREYGAVPVEAIRGKVLLLGHEAERDG